MVWTAWSVLVATLKRRGLSIYKMCSLFLIKRELVDQIFDLVDPPPPEITVSINTSLVPRGRHDDWQVVTHFGRGYFEVSAVVYGLIDRAIEPQDSLAVLNAQDREFFLGNREFVPEAWKTAEIITFPGTRYDDGDGNQYYGAAMWNGRELEGFYVWLGDPWFANCQGVVRTDSTVNLT